MPFNKETGLYELEEISFYNTSEVTEMARHYKKEGCYTFEPEGSRAYTELWDREEDRRKNGMIIPGQLITVKETRIIDNHPRVFERQEIKQIHITPKHYGFLNYGRIKITKDDDTEEIKYQTGNTPKHARKVGKKEIDFPRFIDGQFHWFTSGKVAREMGMNRIAAKARRKGFSYMEGFDVADEINMNPEVTCLVVAYDMKYLIKGNQILPMAKRYLDWFETQTDFGRGYLKEEKDHIKLGFKKQGMGHIEYGFQSEVIGLSLMNNPDAPAGKDAVIIKFEESGKNPLLKDSLDITMSTTEDGGYVTGTIDIFGTGGTKDANWADFQEIYYNPADYNCMAYDNIWDEGCRGTPAGFFYPQEIGDPLYIDEHGNSMVKEALQAHEIKTAIAKRTKSQSGFIRWVGQRARCGREAFASGSDNIFPTAEIVDQLARVEHNPDFKYLRRCGELVRTGTGLRFKTNEMLQAEGVKVHEPIFNFPLKKDQDVAGCYVEWFSPYRDPKTGLIPKGLYRIWHDPYAHDKDKKDLVIKDSLGATYVYERLNNVTPGGGDYLVACYIGRPPSTDMYNENLLKIAEYWNAQVMFENDRGDVKGYFTRQRKSHYLADEPELKWVVELQGKSNRQKGINMTPKRKSQGAIYLRDWVMEPRGKDVWGNEKINLHYIYDAAFLRELLKWNLKGNFDRVSAAIVGMYDMKECFDMQVKQPPNPNKESFFKRKMFTNDRN